MWVQGACLVRKGMTSRRPRSPRRGSPAALRYDDLRPGPRGSAGAVGHESRITGRGRFPASRLRPGVREGSRDVRRGPVAEGSQEGRDFPFCRAARWSLRRDWGCRAGVGAAWGDGDIFRRISASVHGRLIGAAGSRANAPLGRPPPNRRRSWSGWSQRCAAESPWRADLAPRQPVARCSVPAPATVHRER